MTRIDFLKTVFIAIILFITAPFAWFRYKKISNKSYSRWYKIGKNEHFNLIQVFDKGWMKTYINGELWESINLYDHQKTWDEFRKPKKMSGNTSDFAGWDKMLSKKDVQDINNIIA